MRSDFQVIKVLTGQADVAPAKTVSDGATTETNAWCTRIYEIRTEDHVDSVKHTELRLDEHGLMSTD